MKLPGGPSSGRRPATSRGAKRRAGRGLERGVTFPGMGFGVSPRADFEI